MKRRLIIVGTAVVVLAGAGFVTAQTRTGYEPRQAGVAQAGQEPRQFPQRGPFRGMGPGRGQRGGGGGSMLGRGPGGIAALNLSEDQRAKINELHRATRDQVAPLADELELLRKTLHREVFAEQRDDAKVADLAAKVAALQGRIADLHLKTSLAVAGVLTAEQRESMRLREGPGAGRGRGIGRQGFGRGRF